MWMMRASVWSAARSSSDEPVSSSSSNSERSSRRACDGARAEQVDDGVDPAIEPLDRRAAGRQRAHQRGLHLAQDALDHRRVELRLGGEVVEERRLAEPDRVGDLAQADAGEAAPREQRLCGIENLLPWRELSSSGSHFPTDRSVEPYRSNGRESTADFAGDATRVGT